MAVAENFINPLNTELTEKWANSDEGQELLRQIEAHIIDPDADTFWTPWHSRMANYFLDPRLNGYLDYSAQLNIDQAFKTYEKEVKPSFSNSTFFGFLLWHFIQVLKRPEDIFKTYHFRKIQNTWYIVNNPAIVIPVYLSGGKDIKEAVIQNAYKIETLSEWLDIYTQAVTDVRAGVTQPIPPTLFTLSHMFGNLPGIPFDSFNLHFFPKSYQGRIFAYFGQRYFPGLRFFPGSGLKGAMHVPFTIKYPHGTVNPTDVIYILEEFLKTINHVK